MKKFSRTILVLLSALMLAFVIAGCEGKDGVNGITGPEGVVGRSGCDVPYNIWDEDFGVCKSSFGCVTPQTWTPAVAYDDNGTADDDTDDTAAVDGFCSVP